MLKHFFCFGTFVNKYVQIIYLPEIIFLRNGKLLRDVTLLLSTDRSTDGNGVGVSECDRSCTGRPPFCRNSLDE